MLNAAKWQGPEGNLGRWLVADGRAALEAYRVRPELVKEHDALERSTVESGYGRKQLNELAQNAADAMRGMSGRLAFVLTESSLYCANEGDPLTQGGLEALLMSHSSQKRDDEIGRFGLGFKSVLQLTDAPQIISRTVSVKWDRARSAAVISGVVGGRERYPALRLAEPFDPVVAAATDQVLSELMDWATTIVRIPLKDRTPWLDEELERFPHEFILFADHIDTLDLDNRRTGKRKTWTADRRPYPHGLGERVVLQADGQAESWDVFRVPHQPSPEAAKDAGSVAARSELKLTWAVPLKSRGRGLGRVWNYFPTQSYTTLSGIINAAFKLNEDRENMLAGLYNEEILTKSLPRVVAFALPDLVDPQDPGSILDILPARGREARSWADEVLNKPVMATVAAMTFVPDRMGVLRAANELQIEPELDQAERLESMWDAAVGRERPWAHRSLTSNAARNHTLNRLLSMANKERAGVRAWLEEVVHPRTAESFLAALEIAVEINQRFSELASEMRSARIVPAGDGSLQAPIGSALFVPIDDDDNAPNLVSLEFVRHRNARELLRKLDIGLLDAQGRLKKAIAAIRSNPADRASLEAFWALSRSVDLPSVLQLLQGLANTSLPVRCEDGQWRPIGEVWLRGDLFPQGSMDDASLVVDSSFHAQDMRVLKALKVHSDLGDPVQISSGRLHQLWKDAISETIEAHFRNSPTPVSGIHLAFGQPFATPGLELLSDASAEVRRRATERILDQPHYEVRVKINNQYVSDRKVFDPDIWWARNHGTLKTPLGLVEARNAVAGSPDIPDGFLPVALDQRAADLLALPADPATYSWPYIYTLANRSLGLSELHQLYGIAALHGFRKPEHVSVMTKHGRAELPFEDAQVATDRRTYEHFAQNREAAVLFVESDELRLALVDQWNLPALEVRFESKLVAEGQGDPLPLMKRIPFIHKAVSGISKLITVPCENIRIETTNDAGDPPAVVTRQAYLEGDTFYYLETMTPRIWLQALLDSTGKKVDSRIALDNAQQAKKEHDQAERLRKIQAKQTDEEKLLELVGESTIRSLIPNHVFALLNSRSDEEISGTALVRLASTLHGASLLQKIRPFLEEQGIETPSQFKGSSAARSFVRKLGISEDFAGSSEIRKPVREEVMGPVRLSAMHDYQVDVSKQILAVLERETENRAIVQLPTGAGKTRVAVESVIQHVGRSEGQKLVVWVAQTEELCEQAVEAWLYVWQGAGVPEQRMAVGRLWDGRRPKPEETRLHVVVATIQTLSSIVQDAGEREEYAWLFGADILIVDEAHGAIAPTYTDVFRAFGRGNSQRGKPLIGLSATPYKGTNEAETTRLVRRFDGHLLMPSLFTTDNAHAYLQSMGVLARVRHEALDGIELQLTKGVQRPDRGDSAMLETRIDLDVVAKSKTRNDTILDHLHSVAPKETALVFAASVDHAEALAATLTAEGIRAAAISSKTNPSDRRREIEDFRSGKIRVLTNFDVLSQGFDAPKVGAVYVCRPTFTPNKYLQMIGRGLRGPKNGGSEEVLIVNVKDNIDQFGQRLAFNHFEYLWNRES